MPPRPGRSEQCLPSARLEDGDEVPIPFGDPVSSYVLPVGDAGTGGWAGLIDAEQLKRDIYTSRQIQTRRAPEL